MNVLSYFARNSFIRLLSFAVTLGSAFVVTPHMLRCLGDSAYGMWALISSMAGYFMLLDLGLLQAVCKYASAAQVKNDLVERESVYSTAFGLNVLACLAALLITGVLVLGTGSLLGNEAPQSAGVALGIFMASVAVQLLFRSSQALMAADMRWRDLALLAMLRTLLTTCGVLWLLAENSSPARNIVLVAMIMAFGNTLECLGHIVLAAIGGSRPHPARLSLQKTRELIRYGLPVVAVNMGDLLRQRSQVFVVAAILGLGPVALFSLAQQLMAYIGNVMLNVFGIMAPYFSRLQAGGKMEDCRRSLLDAMMLSYSASTYFGLCAIFYGGLFISRWLGPQYGKIDSLLPMLGVAGMVGFGGMVVNGFLLGLGEHRILAALSVGEGLICLAAGIPATAMFGLEGMACSICAAALITQLGILPFRACRAAGLSPASYYVALLGPVAAQTCLQYLYYLLIRGWLAADYPVLALACAGQALVGLTLPATFFLCFRVDRQGVEPC